MKILKWLIIALAVCQVLLFGVILMPDSPSRGLLMLVVFIGAVLAIGLILFLLGVGAWWSERLMTRGAQIAVDVGGNTGTQASQTMKLFRELRKEAHSGGPQAALLPLPPSGLLPPSATNVQPDGDEFVIDGLDGIQ